MPRILYQRGREVKSSRRVFVAIPTYTGNVGALFSMSMFETIQILDKAEIGIDLCIQTGNCHVDDARNAMIREFLKTDCTDFVFIDEDVGFDGADLYRLCMHEVDFVAGVYPCKQDEVEFPALFESGKEIWSDKNGLIEADAVPTGFLRMTRNVIDTMVKHFGERSFYGRGQENESPHRILFERTYEDGKRYSGDYAFCRKWKSIGGKIYINPDFNFSHSGVKSWSGNFASYLREKNGVNKSELKGFVDELRNGNDDISVFNGIFKVWGNHFSATPEMLKEVYLLRKNTIGVALECGSGISTIVLAAAGGNVVSLENDSSWYGKMVETLYDLGFNNGEIDLVYSPISDFKEFKWYDYASSEENFSIVVCDGPKREYGREGLFFNLIDNISGANLIIDDTNDPIQLELVKKYCSEFKFNGRYSTGVIK